MLFLQAYQGWELLKWCYHFEINPLSWKGNAHASCRCYINETLFCEFILASTYPWYETRSFMLIWKTSVVSASICDSWKSMKVFGFSIMMHSKFFNFYRIDVFERGMMYSIMLHVDTNVLLRNIRIKSILMTAV